MNKEIIDRHLVVLDLNYPFTESELKTAFRMLAFKCHPDKGGSPQEFIKVKAAYDALVEFAIQSNGDKPNFIRTTEGKLLSELGKGLPDTVNSNICSQCHGAGYIERKHYESYFDTVCPRCHGMCFIRVKPRKSMFFNYWYDEIPCPVCLTAGGLGRHEIVKTLYHICDKCRGIGQIEVPNPVLRKNRFNPQKQVRPPKPQTICRKCGAKLQGGKCWRCEGWYSKTGGER